MPFSRSASVRNRIRGFALSLSVFLLWDVAYPLNAQFGQPRRGGYRPPSSNPLEIVLGGLGTENPTGPIIISAILGGVLGAFFSPKFKRFRKWFWLGLSAILIVVVLKIAPILATIPVFIFSFIAAYTLLSYIIAAQIGRRPKPTEFGSAEWADDAHIARMQEEKILGSEGLFVGLYESPTQTTQLYYTGQRHLLTVAPTRSGKGTTAIIPNLLSYQGSALVIDPKGENAKITALRRGSGDPGRNLPGMGQDVHVVDPWETTGLPPSRFNPMLWLDPADNDIGENAMMLADSIVVPQSGGTDAFWDEEAKALLMGIILYVATDATEQQTRTLGRVRDIIVSSESDFEATFQKMFQNSNPIVKSTASRHASKDEKLRGSVLASLQSHTHFLDSQRIRKSLSGDDFRFEDMKSKPITVYLVLPADRLGTFGRWLRLLVQQAITMNARNIDKEPKRPILFVLDEMAALGRLSMVEQAFGLMAGFGMQMWGIVQDVSQLERIYEEGWETFVGNSGVLQYLGSRDEKTAAYFSKLCGVSTIDKVTSSSSTARSSGPQGGSTTNTDSSNYDLIQRPLVFPDELMVFRKEQALILIENYNAINGKRVRWFDDPKLKQLGIDLKKPAHLPLP